MTYNLRSGENSTVDSHTLLEGIEDGMSRKRVILQLRAYTLGLAYLQFSFPVSVTYGQPWLKVINGNFERLFLRVTLCTILFLATKDMEHQSVQHTHWYYIPLLHKIYGKSKSSTGIVKTVYFSLAIQTSEIMARAWE